MKKILIYISTLLFATALTIGCSVKFYYNQLDLMAPWYIKSHINLDDDQTEFIKQRVLFHLQWHRHTQLPEYSALLRKAISLIDHSKTSNDIPLDTIELERSEHPIYADLGLLQTELKSLNEELAERIAPDLAELFLTATDEQLQGMYQNLESNNDLYRAEYVDVQEEDLRELRRLDLQKQIERWVGSLTPVQKKLINDWSKKFNPVSTRLLGHRVSWQQSLVDVMSQPISTNNKKNELVELFTHPEKAWQPEYQVLIDDNNAMMNQVFSKIVLSLTKRQKHRLIKKMQHLARSFDELAQEKR